jgi:phosphoribosylformimino-5-aminoimidazole carboxamide ribotide isomerase
LVNLDGAFGEKAQANLIALERILSLGTNVQFGGGLRDMDALRWVFDRGIERAVLGTAAVEDPGLVNAALRAFGAERIVLGIDARAGVVRTRGWTEESTLKAVDLAREWAEQGVRWAVFTDVVRDGTGMGLDVAAAAALAGESGLQVIASGGVDGLDDVRQVYDAGLAGVIIGRALYEGSIALSDALAIGESTQED